METVKLIIEIPKEVKDLLDGKISTLDIDLYSTLIQVVKSGTIVDSSVLEDIKTEIAQAIAYATVNYFNWGEVKGLQKAINIIDKHMESDDNR